MADGRVVIFKIWRIFKLEFVFSAAFSFKNSYDPLKQREKIFLTLEKSYIYLNAQKAKKRKNNRMLKTLKTQNQTKYDKIKL